MIHYYVIEKGQPGVSGGGEKKFYAVIKRKGVISLEDLSKEIAGRSTMSEGDVTGVLISMVEAMEAFLSKGFQINLGRLGDLRLSISSRGEEAEDEVSKFSIRRAKLLFIPSRQLRETLKSLKFARM
jgi:predicted histone-like DNA-binding protein